jgi:hypothetical protein
LLRCECWERSLHPLPGISELVVIFYAANTGIAPRTGLRYDAPRLAKEERRFPTGYYEFVINHTDNDRRAVLAAPRYDVLGERQADGTLPRRRRVAIVRHS